MLRMAWLLIACVMLASALATAASGASYVNAKCYGNRADKPNSLRWWADCADAWGPHAFTEQELRGAKGSPRKVETLSGTKYLSYGNCAFGFNRQHQAISGLCL
jgi:hypothetical protein